MADPRQQERRQTSNNKHCTPAIVAADAVVRQRSEEYPDVIPRVHETRTHAAAMLRPLLGNERPTHGPFSANANSGEQSQNRKLPNTGDEGAQKGERRIPQDGQHQRAHAAELVSNRPP